jgi:peptidoglycan/LPS O-acetylase OafA/YrhL
MSLLERNSTTKRDANGVSCAIAGLTACSGANAQLVRKPRCQPDGILSNGRIVQLDLLRGVAILLVLGAHLEIPRPQGVWGSFVALWTQVGWIGVDLFFVLSGFLISGLLFRELEFHGRIRVGHFLIRRGLKIYPPYAAFLAYVVLWSVTKAIGNGNALAALTSKLLELCRILSLFIIMWVRTLLVTLGRLQWRSTFTF